MCWQKHAVNEIDYILTLVLKLDDKWKPLITDLSQLLNGIWDEQTKSAIKEAIDYFSKAEGDVKASEAEDVLSTLEKRLGGPIAEQMRTSVAEAQLKAYQKGYAEVGVKFAFNKTNKAVLAWLENNQTYWIGQYYSDQISGKVGNKVNEMMQQIISEGFARENAGNLMKNELKTFFQTPEGYRDTISSYFEGLASHIMTQTREFSHVDAYEAAGVEYIKINAVMDHRTSAICREMNGRIIPVSHLKEQREKILSAKSPEEAKKYSPWLSDKQVKTDVSGKSTKEILSSKVTKNIGLPPYHWKCRTTTVIATEEEYKEKLTSTHTPDAPSRANGIPVSSALDNKTNGATKTAVDNALSIIDTVHGDGQLPKIPILQSSGENTLGTFAYYSSTGTPIRINISSKGMHKELTAFHEIGHFLDHSGIGTPNVDSTASRDPLLDEWRTAIFNSQTVKNLANVICPHITLIKHKRYLLKDQELFARSYAQYIAKKSEMPELQSQIDGIINSSTSLRKFSQWEDDDFKGIEKAFDNLMVNLGWVK